jgi:signal transduction histidine kinase
LLKSIESGNRNSVILELEAVHKDGHTLPVEISANFLFDEQGNPVEILGVARDIAERKQVQAEKARLEAQKQLTKKTKSLERMAGSIAHHFNNLLAVVIGNLELGMDDQSKGESLIENLSEAMKAAHRAADLSTLMLTYLGVTPGELEFIDVSEACRSHLPLLQTTMSNDVILKSDLLSPCPTVSANTTQIKQVLTQLISNAREAIGNEQGFIQLGVKALSAADIPTSNRFPVDWQPQDKNYICLAVSDTGHGIAQKDIENLFDPFFSSKFTGRGLGLSVLLGIVRMHQGAVAVKSEPGRGSVFQVFLPVGPEV